MAKASPTQARLWHRRLSHLNFDYINLLSKKDVVIGLPKLKYVKDQLCPFCKVSKAKRSSFKTKIVPGLKGRLNLLHMDFCGQMRVTSINGKKYILVIVDDYSRYTWTLFLRSKDETPEVSKDFLTMIQRNLQALVISVRTDRGTEFLNKTLNTFFKQEGIEHQTSTPRTPKQNGVASDYDNSDPDPQLQNVSPSTDTTVPSQQELDFLFGPLYDEFFNTGTSHVNKSSSPNDNSVPQDTHPLMNIQPTSEPTTLTNAHAKENNDNQADDTEHEFTNPFYTLVHEVTESSSRNIVHRNPSKPLQTRRQLATDPKMCMFALTMSIIEPKNIKEAMADSAWIEAMQEELHQFDRIHVWELVDKPFGKNVIKLKWLWKNKKDEDQTATYADHAGCVDTRKSTSGRIQFLGAKLVNWMSKKQDCTAMSSAEAEYVALSASCAQVMWMRTQLKDYGFKYNKIPLYCDSQSAIAISCNPVQHSRTKHIHTRYHFIKEWVENGIIELYFVKTKYQLADMFTKALPEDRFQYLVRRIGMRCLTLAELEVLTNESA
ncbi:retrovirus-related pol polyprotein from transposon TNT 1-94 [Tanacetum coccineum]